MLLVHIRVKQIGSCIFPLEIFLIQFYLGYILQISFKENQINQGIFGIASYKTKVRSLTRRNFR